MMVKKKREKVKGRDLKKDNNWIVEVDIHKIGKKSIRE